MIKKFERYVISDSSHNNINQLIDRYVSCSNSEHNNCVAHDIQQSIVDISERTTKVEEFNRHTTYHSKKTYETRYLVEFHITPMTNEEIEAYETSIDKINGFGIRKNYITNEYVIFHKDEYKPLSFYGLYTLKPSWTEYVLLFLDNMSHDGMDNFYCLGQILMPQGSNELFVIWLEKQLHENERKVTNNG